MRNLELRFALIAALLSLGGVASAQNAITVENALPGNPPSEWDVSGAGDESIQGFATDISVDQGETVRFKIDTPSTDYRLDIYRLGYYGGNGARKVATVQPSAALPQIQPGCLVDPTTGLVDCGNWAESASWAVPANATSGIYVAKLVREDPEDGRASHVVFVVRDDDGGSDILFQTSDTTWQAYNAYGGNSLYTGSPAGRAYKVSYNRPFTTRCCSWPAGEIESWIFAAEYPMVRWLERNGYDVSYTTGVDSDRRGAEILEHGVFMQVGHDEYWSGDQRANVEAARDAGVHMMVLSGNTAFWKTRWETSIDGSGTPYRTLVCYKETLDNAKIDPLPGVWTGTWRDPRFGPHDGGRPENELLGPLFTVNGPRYDAISVPAADGKMRFWRDTDIATLAPGATATLPAGVLGFEWDEDIDNGFRPPGMVRMSSTTVTGVSLLQDYGGVYEPGTATHHLTLYRAPSGALVFGAGTVQWSWGLDANHDNAGTPVDPRMQQATVNVLADMGVQPLTLQSGLVQASASSDFTPPTAVITAPSSGSAALTGIAVNITGTASDVGGEVGAVEVSTDDGASWHPAIGRGTWSYVWVPSATGVTTLRARAVDDSGNLQTSSAGVTVTVTLAVPQSILVTPDPATIAAGAVQQFTAMGTFASGEGTLDLTNLVTWSSSSPSVATVNETGLAAGLAAGSTTISATLNGVVGNASLAVSPPAPLVVTSASLPNGNQGIVYNQALEATGGLLPYTWSLDAGQLPAGLALAGDTGVISGTPTAIGVSNFTVRVTGGAQTATANLSITVDAPPPPPDEGPGGPILVISNAADRFGRYYVEILRNEGFNLFTATDIDNVTPALLAAHEVVVLAPQSLTPTQVSDLADFASAGGTLIAMRPVPALASLLGLTPAAGSPIAEGYLQIDTNTGPGVGLESATLQYHGSADRWDLSGATALATLFSTPTTPTPHPAVTRRTVGAGEAIAFAFDLARSVVYTRQGNPAWNLQERDGFSPRRSDDLFYGAAAGDPQPDWIDLDKVAIPQADEQQRLLANLILDGSDFPLPRFWYFPSGHKAVVLMTGDEHGCCDGTQARFDAELAASPPGCSVDDWQCVRSSSYIYPVPGWNAQALAYSQQGFEVGVHINTGCADWTPQSLQNQFDLEFTNFTAYFPSVAGPASNRTHCIAWSDWATQAKVERTYNVRLDTNYYYWPPAWVGNRPGFFTGSGMPMRFADLDGTMIDVYQAATQMTDESGQPYPDTAAALLDAALGPQGYYGVFTANMHTDIGNGSSYGWASQITAAALARGVPVVSGRQLLTWLDGRNASTFSNLAWDGTSLTFDVTRATGARNLRGMVPIFSDVGVLTSLRRNGSPIAFTTETIKGVFYAIYDATTGSYEASYAIDTAPPVVSGVSVTPAATTATVTWTTDESATSTVLYGTSPDNLVGSASVPGLSPGHSVTIQGLAPETTYYARVVSADNFANSTTEPQPPAPPLSFTTLQGPPPPPLVITTSTLPNGTTLAPYAATLAASGGIPPYTWSISAGSLPPGLTLAANGSISGAPTATGVSNFTVEVIAGSQSTTKPLAITVTEPGAPVSVWPDTTVPPSVAVAEPPVELGVKFRTDVPGYILGVRFYKFPQNVGTHVGNLWSGTGTPLATAVFTNETASGWQQVNFPQPIQIAANTTYVASYFAPGGFYAYAYDYFATQGVDVPPLHLPSSPAAGGNGVFRYASPSSFPTDSFRASNYWVDVVFSTAPPLESIAVTPVAPAVPTGGTQQFTATGTYFGGGTQDITNQVTWASATPAVATISSAGLATALTPGTAAISATKGAISGGTTLEAVPADTLVITTTSLPNGTANVAYSAPLAATGGVPPYTWSIATGTLPEGIALDPGTGVLSGTATAPAVADVTVQVSDLAQSATQPLTLTILSGIECSDGVDSDGDGLVDFPEDPGCASAADLSERSPLLPCDDGADNDGDGRIDFSPIAGNGDPGCHAPIAASENPACQDGVNNDAQPGTDFDGGQSIHGACTGLPGGCPPGVDDPEADGVPNADPQCVGKPWQGSEASSRACGLGTEMAVLLPLLQIWRRRRCRGAAAAA